MHVIKLRALLPPTTHEDADGMSARPSTTASMASRISHDVELRAFHARWHKASAAFAAQIRHAPESGNIVGEQARSYLNDARRRTNCVVCEAGFFRACRRTSGSSPTRAPPCTPST